MVWGRPSLGTKKCRKFTVLVNSANTTQIISTALTGYYCPLNHNRNGSVDFVNRLHLIQ